jgi:hypothetical protein
MNQYDGFDGAAARGSGSPVFFTPMLAPPHRLFQLLLLIAKHGMRSAATRKPSITGNMSTGSLFHFQWGQSMSSNRSVGTRLRS